MTHIKNIKDLYHVKGLNVAEISRVIGHDRKTIDSNYNSSLKDNLLNREFNVT